MFNRVNGGARVCVLACGLAVSGTTWSQSTTPVEVPAPASPAEAVPPPPKKPSRATQQLIEMLRASGPKATAWTVVQVPQGKVRAMRLNSVGGGLFQRTTGGLGMRPGDVIFAVDSQRVRSTADFDALFKLKTNMRSMIRLDFVRDGVVHQVIGPVDVSTLTMWKVAPKWGGDYEEATVDFGPELLEKPVIRTVNAVQINSVHADTAAAKAGMRAKDVMILLNGHGIGHLRTGDTIVPLVPEGTPVEFVWLRDGVRMEGVGPVTRVRTGLAKTLMFGFNGSPRMVDVPGGEKPQALVE